MSPISSLQFKTDVSALRTEVTLLRQSVLTGTPGFAKRRSTDLMKRWKRLLLLVADNEDITERNAQISEALKLLNAIVSLQNA